MFSPMTIETICSSKMNKTLKHFGEDVARSVIIALSEKYDFPTDEALSAFSVTVLDKRPRPTRDSRPSSRMSSRSSVGPSMLPLPFCGNTVEGWCSGIRPNGGLFTQCSNEPDGDSPYCGTCQRQAKKNSNTLPNGGDIGDRIAKGAEWRCPKGKAPIRLANFLKKSGKDLTDELRVEINEAASAFGWTIPDDEWMMKPASRGRPRKQKTAVVDTTATEDEGNNSSPSNKQQRKVKKTNSGSEMEQASDSSDGEQLVLATPSNSSLVTRRITSAVISPIVGENSEVISPIVMNSSDKSAPKKVKMPKMSAEEKEAAKAAKLAEKEAAKEATKAAKLAEKEAAKEATKATKLAEKEATKATKLAEKEAATSTDATVITPAPENNTQVVEKMLETTEIYEAETDGEDSDDAAGVEEFVHKGEKYLRDPSTNDIFDYAVFIETGDAEEIGTWDPISKSIDLHDE